MKQKRGSKKCLPWAGPGSGGLRIERGSGNSRQKEKESSKKKKWPWSGSCGKASTTGIWPPQPRQWPQPAGLEWHHRWCMCREAGFVLSSLFPCQTPYSQNVSSIMSCIFFAIGRAWPPWTKATRWTVWTKCLPICSSLTFHCFTGAGEDRQQSQEGHLDSVQLWFCQFVLHGFLNMFSAALFFTLMWFACQDPAAAPQALSKGNNNTAAKTRAPKRRVQRIQRMSPAHLKPSSHQNRARAR